MRYPDIFFTPEYQELFKDTAFGGEPKCVQFAGIEYRFYKRQIEGTDYFDIVSPYGYSGPIPISKADIIYWGYDITFNLMFHQYCLENNIIAEFARLHPFLQNHLYLDRVIKSGEVYYIDLTQPFKFDKGCKSSIKKAERITAKRTLADISPDDFHKVYNETMVRDKSYSGYLFSLDFFEKLFRLPGIVFGAYRDNRMLACISVLTSNDYAHYFLSGSTLEGRQLNCNNLLLWEAIRWAKTQGYKIFNLGGGLNGKLTSFKRSFSKTAMPFYTYRKIHNEEAYDMLCYDKGIIPGSVDYFPEYRYVER